MLVGDGFTAAEVHEALKPKLAEPWHPPGEYAECEIRDLYPGPRAVSFMGRIANIFDVVSTPKTPRSAKGCVKLCVKDDKAAITVGHAALDMFAIGNTDCLFRFVFGTWLACTTCG